MMRILRIRCKNLNSLAGCWEVDLSHQEYQTEGCFLITGSTGSGKTTLLDAISLALYGRTPRLKEVNASRDEIMTRHTSEAVAEVDFQTSKGLFRAHWSHKRAKGKNPFGQTVRKLYRIVDGEIEIISDSKADAREAIEACVGLNYEQFTRAIMLAQGEFAQFLKAKEKEKAPILEKLTNTGIYTELSKHAFVKTKEAKYNMDNKAKELADVQILGEEEVKAMAAEKEACEEELQRIGKQLEQCGENMNWLRRIAALKAEGRTWDEQYKKLQKNLAEFAPVETKLLMACTALPLTETYTNLDSLRIQKQTALAKMDEIKGKIIQADEILASTSKNLNTANNNHAQAQSILQQMRPILDQVRLLDQDINRRLALAREHGTKQNLCQQNCDKLNLIWQQIQGKQQNLQNEITEITSWQSSHSAYGSLVENLSWIKERLTLREEKKITYGKWQQEQQLCEGELAKIAKKQSQQEAEHRRALGNLELARKDFQQLQHERQKCLQNNTLEGLKELREQVRISRIQAEAIQSLEDRRANLQDGQPCPLCGATHHPWAQGANLPNANELEDRYQKLHEQITAVENIESKLQHAWNKQLEAEKQTERLNNALQLTQTEKNAMLLRRDNSIAELAKVSEAMTGILKTLSEVLSPLGLNAQQNSKDLLAALHQQLNQWREAEAKFKHCSEELQMLANDAAANEAARQQASGQLEELRADGTLIQMELNQKKKDRESIFGQKNVDQEDQRLQRDAEQALKKLDTLNQERMVRERERANLAGKEGQIVGDLHRVEEKLQQVEAEFARMLQNLGWDENQYLCHRQKASVIAQWQEQQQKLQDERSRLEGLLAANAAKLEQELTKELTTETEETLEQQRQDLGRRNSDLHGKIAQIKAALDADTQKQAQAAKLKEELENASQEYIRWSELNDVMGSSDGKKFSAFAQSITLDALLAHANVQLGQLLDRYRFHRCRGDDGTGLEVIDSYQADEHRPLQNLSGGETFLASLALALGLSHMASRNTPIGALFLDEGFGSLDEDTLEQAIDTIKNLRGENKLIGIISHVEALKAHLPFQIELRHTSSGRSAIIGSGCRRMASI